MLTATARVSSKNQIVLPREVRDELNVKSGDELLFIIRDGEIVVRSRPASFAQAMRGLHKNIWAGIEAKDWLAQERSSWE
jgi:AbrB family looped-hinge helix DNA binding protein